MNSHSGTFLIAIFALLLGATSPFAAESVISSKHNLSVSGPGEVRASLESEICIFCHTPHRAVGAQPLWNRQLSQATYTPYNSTTLKATVGQPTGASKLCLSCHDGTVALGMLNSRPSGVEMRGGITMIPVGPSRIGTDLSGDHPVSFIYNSGLVTANGHLREPSALNQKVRLDHNNEMQCTSCHDPHNNEFGKFLVQDNYASALCVQCHDVTGWQNSLHRTSTKTWNGAGENPWHTTQTTMAANACENCHTSHKAGTKARLLNFADEEKNCVVCHSGNVATKDVNRDFNKISAHPIRATTAVHDPTEDPINPPRHVECADCHNGHAVSQRTATAPDASGALDELTGVDQNGAVVKPLTREYELCFRCHADSVARGPARVSRVTVQTNTRLEFQSSNLSFHPVETVGKNPNEPSLLAPLTTSTRIYCSSCHNSDEGPGVNGNGANGPHGSSFVPILERELSLVDGAIETEGTYALCYKCHSRASILADESFPHRIHVVDNKASCVTCHDSHGVQNSARLINFNSLYVTPLNGRLEFNSTGTFRGNCTLTCHRDSANPTFHDAISATNVVVSSYGSGALLPSMLRKPAPSRIPRRR